PKALPAAEAATTPFHKSYDKLKSAPAADDAATRRSQRQRRREALTAALDEIEVAAPYSPDGVALLLRGAGAGAVEVDATFVVQGTAPYELLARVLSI